MGSQQGAGRSQQVSEARDADAIREEIESTRKDLGDTVEALSAKTDVKAQAKRKVEGAKASVSETKDEVAGKLKEATPASVGQATQQITQTAKQHPAPLAAVGLLAAGFLLGRLSAR